MKKTVIITIAISLATLFVGCGGGGSDSSFEGTTGTIAVVTCDNNDSAINTTWTDLQSGDTVVAETDTELLWKQTTIKQVCEKIGSAEVVR